MPPHIFCGGAAGGAALAEALGAALVVVAGGKMTPPGGGSCAGGVEDVQALVGKQARIANSGRARQKLMPGT
jgi:hypothetical protein